jgi:hypothetical protein
MQGTYVLSALIIGAFILWPEETAVVLTASSIKIQIYFINLRMKWAAWRMYRSLVKMCKEAGFPSPGPFVFVDIWDREPLD